MSQNKQSNSVEINIGKNVKDACLRAAKEGFRDASMRGLCTEGAIEAAVGAIQSVDVEAIVAETIKADR